MSDICLDFQGSPGTPTTGKGILYLDRHTGSILTRDGTGTFRGAFHRASVAAQGAGFSSDTYVTGSGLLLPEFSTQAGMTFRWVISASKTAAGTSTPTYQIRVGTTQTTSDTARLALVGPAQTAATDVGVLVVAVTVRTVGSATGIFQGTAAWIHQSATAGFANNVNGATEGTSAAFDNAGIGGSYVGLSINGGASAAWTLTQVLASWEV